MAESNGKGRSGETERYREAATGALEMLDWCIGYLTGTRKERIAAQLAKNRTYLRKKLMQEADEPLPTSKD
jgi:hypothetical protein